MEQSEIYTAIKSSLLQQYGHLISGQDLAHVLGYRNLAALRQARCRGQVSLPIFSIDSRTKKFALTVEVASWLVERRFQGSDTERKPEEGRCKR